MLSDLDEGGAVVDLGKCAASLANIEGQLRVIIVALGYIAGMVTVGLLIVPLVFRS